MPTARACVLDVGNCSPDHDTIRRMLTAHFDVDVDREMYVDDAQARMREKAYRLVLFNRLIFGDDSEGIELLRQAKADDSLAKTPMMMISNYAKAQEASVAAGGVPGFGKNAVRSPETVEMLSHYLPRKSECG